MKLGHRDVLEAAAYPAKQMLMRAHVRIEPTFGPRRAYPSDQILALKKLERPVDRRLRQTGKLLYQPGVNRFGSRMSQVRGERSIDCKPLRRDSNAPGATLPLEIRAPIINFADLPAPEFVAGHSHLRIIIIWMMSESRRKFKSNLDAHLI
jgi:hypothetical protein